MDTNESKKQKEKRRRKNGWLWLLVVMSLACVGGWKWMEYSSAKKNEQAPLDLSLQEKSMANSLAAVKEMAAESLAAVKEMADENARLRAENALLETRLKDCKPVPETKRVVPRVKKPRVSKPKSCEKKVVSKPKEKAPIPPKAVAPAPAPQAKKVKEPCPAGETLKITAGRWQCVKDEPKSPTEAPPIVVAAPETSSFAKAIDEEIGAQGAVSTFAVTAVQVPLHQPCPAYIDSSGMQVREGERRVTNGGSVDCN